MQSTKPWIEELMTAGYKVLVIIIVVIVIIQELISSASSEYTASSSPSAAGEGMLKGDCSRDH